MFIRSDVLIVGGSVLLIVAGGLTRFMGAGAVAAFITFDGESDWGEGMSMLALYAIIATPLRWS